MTDQQRPPWAVRLQAEREARRWGKFAMARHLLEAVGIAPTPQKVKTLSRQILGWEKGDHFPRDWASAYATAYDIPMHELFPGPPLNRATVPVGTVGESSTPDQGDDDVKRRAALQIIAALAAGTAIPPGALETVFSGIDDALGNPLDLAEWDATVHEYGQLLVTRPTGTLINDLTADIIAVGEILKRRHNAPDTAGLLRVSAGLSGVLAIDLGDSGDQRAARMSWNAAKRAADASGDRDLRVWVRGRAAQDAFWARRPDQVITNLTGEAIEIANGAPSAGLARAHAARSYVAADHGDTRKANESLGDLHRTFDQVPQIANDQSVLVFRETQFRWAQTYVYTRTGDDRAGAALSRARALYPTDSLAPVANLALMESAVLIRAGEVDIGLQQAVNTLHTGPEARAAGTNLLGRQILQTVPERAQALPAARELRTLTAVT
ncbi:XRE family transcriptional regulator [Spirillospora sp. NBC_01491]|uniref:XRE family transcriptional regulator n=1 Tax=Spirillospora sp. NBC_01491 TaxID=2976007 RepID=UPI002E3340AB|nr:XRE family transcriptional regulator [Spirillospora sp. NBC_01491]